MYHCMNIIPHQLTLLFKHVQHLIYRKSTFKYYHDNNKNMYTSYLGTYY